MGLDKMLKERFDYNLRERINIYAATAMGFFVPVALIRYTAFPERESILGEICLWGASALASIPLTIYPMSTTFGGMCVGILEASNLQKKRWRNEMENESKPDFP